MSKRKEERAAKPGGPLGPWRLSLSIVASAALTGMPLSRAAQTGIGLDMALIRSFVVAFLTWIALSSINRVLVSAEVSAMRDTVDRAMDDDPTATYPVA